MVVTKSATRFPRLTLQISFAVGIKRVVLRLLFGRVVIDRRFNLDEPVNRRLRGTHFISIKYFVRGGGGVNLMAREVK